MHRDACLISLLVLVSSVNPAPAVEAPKPPAPGEDVVIKTLPGIVVDTKAKEVRLESKVCLQRGALELFVCSDGTREHESVLAVKAKPSHLTFALALLGLAPGKPGFMTQGGAFSPPAGAVLDIAVRFADKSGQPVEMPAWKFLRLAGSEEGLDRPIDWVYVGQNSEQALRASDNEGTAVCLSNFVEAVIDVPFESTSANAELLYEANPRAVPPKGTPVEIIIRPTGKRIEARKVEIEVVLKKGQNPTLDGRPIEVPALKDAASAMPAEIRTAVLKADADERFGRVMEIHDLLRDALMKVHLVVMKEAAPAKPAGPALEITVTADDKVRVKGQTLSLEEFRAKAETLLKGVDQAAVVPTKSTSYKTVAEVMAIARQSGVANIWISRTGGGEAK